MDLAVVWRLVGRTDDAVVPRYRELVARAALANAIESKEGPIR